jgi:glycosyltransferase involved in cell wall biosynthesis
LTRGTHGRRPRVLFAVTSSQSLRLLEGFPAFVSSRGWDVHVVADRFEDHSEQDPTVAWHEIRMVRDPSPIRDLISLYRWTRLLIKVRPDMVVAGTPKAGLLGMWSSSLTGVKVRIYFLRGLRLETTTGLRARILSVLERLTSAASTVVIAVSPSLKDEFEARGLAGRRDVLVVGSGSSNGVSLEVSVTDEEVNDLAERIGVDRNTVVVGYVGRINSDKGIADLLRAASAVKTRGTDIHLLILGSEETPGILEAMRTAAGLDAESVTWVGFVPQPAPYYRLMTALCLPTRREGFPNVVLEAAAQGTPAIVSTATGARDSVVHEVTGLLYDLHDPASMADHIRRVASNPEYAKRLGQQARLRVEREFARPVVWDKYFQVYLEALLAGERSPGVGAGGRPQ